MAEHDAHYLIIGSEQYNFRDDTKLPAASPSATGDLTVEGDIYFNEGADPLSTQLSNKADSADLSDKMDKEDPTGSGALSINRKQNTTVGDYSAALGLNNEASGYGSFAVGIGNEATGYGATAEGYETVASGTYSHSEGDHSQASGNYSHSEGNYTESSGNYSHAEGYGTESSGLNSHTEGLDSIASGDQSHAEGEGTEAAGENQHVSGKYNIVDNADTYAEIIGNGTDDNNRSNGRMLDWSGNETIAGDLYFNGGVDPLSTQLSAKADASALPGGYVGDTTAAGQSVAHGTSWTTLLHVDITPGTYIVSWAANFASSGGTNTGYRGAGVATTGDPYAYMSSQVPAVTNNTYTLVSGSALHKTTSNQTLNLKVRQYSTAGSNLTVTPRLQIIKIA